MFIKYFLIPALAIAVVSFLGGRVWERTSTEKQKKRKVLRRIPSKSLTKNT